MFKIIYVWWIVYIITILAAISYLYSALSDNKVLGISGDTLSTIALVFGTWSICVSSASSVGFL